MSEQRAIMGPIAMGMPGRETGNRPSPSTPVGSDQGDTLLDVSEVTDYLCISRSSVYKLIERQQIPAIRIGRLLRVRKDELDKTLRSMGSGA